MRSLPWSRDARIRELRADVWRYVTHVAAREADLQLEAAALLQMAPAELRTLGQAHFILSEEVAALLASMKALARRLATTTVDEEERSAERVRGPIRWGPTLAAQAGTGVRHVYVTAPARRAFDTPENGVLVAALTAIVDVARRTGWHRHEKHLGGDVGVALESAQYWLATRALLSVPVTSPSARTLNRVGAGRMRKRYRPAVEVVRSYQRLVRRLDRSAIRAAVEDHALVTRDDDVLMELLCGFKIERALEHAGWELSRPGLLPSRRCFLSAQRDSARLEMYCQQVPPALAANAHYDQVQRAHDFSSTGSLRPDYVIRLQDAESARWILVEVKGGPRRTVDRSARQALTDLLAYRRNYDHALSASRGPYGLGIAWGEALDPAPSSEVVLCTPDRISEALDRVLA